MTPGQVTPLTVDLHGASHRFKAGASDLVATTQQVYRSAKYPSHLSLPVVVQSLVP